MADFTPPTPEEYAAIIATDHLAFTEECFNQVSPGATYLSNWHVGCFPYEALIQTPAGFRKIGNLVESGYGGYVLSFNHKLNKPEWRRVTQRMKKAGQPLDALLFSTGETIELTGNHEVFINGSYVNAEHVKLNDKALRVVQKGIRPAKQCRSLLRPKMLCGKAFKETFRFLCLRKPKAKSSSKTMSDVLGAIAQKTYANAMRLLWENTFIHSISLENVRPNVGSFLQQEMLWYACAGGQQQSIYRWAPTRAIPCGILEHQENHSNQRAWALLLVWQKVRALFRCSPYRSQQDKQQGMESGGFMPPMSLSPARQKRRADVGIGECYVQEITRTVRIPEAVYNLEVESNNNYFANGILVHNCVCEHLDAVEMGQINSLIINEPPRFLKSISVSIAWPARLLGRNPATQIIVGSYAGSIGTKLSRDTMTVMNSPIYKMAYPRTRLKKETEEAFETTENGHRYVATTGSGITGFGADFILIDDPSNPMESLSDSARVKANEWITGTLFPRANDQNKVKKVMVMQRLHQLDPTGYLLEKGGWHHLKLPVEFKKKTFIDLGSGPGAKQWTMEAGQWLHHERINADTLAKMASEGMSPAQIAGQFYQDPTPPGGGDFKPIWLQYYDRKEIDSQDGARVDASGMNIYILVDPANSKKKSSGHDPDYTVMIVLGLGNDNNYRVLDMVRDRLNPKERIQTLIALHKKWNRKSGKPPKVGYEQYGMMTDAFYLREAQKEISYRFPVVELGGKLAKPERIKQLITPFEDLRVYMPKYLPYRTVSGDTVDLVQELVAEYETFPVGRHDDIMDAFARIMDEKLNAIFPRIPTGVLVRGGSPIGGARGGQNWRDY